MTVAFYTDVLGLPPAPMMAVTPAIIASIGKLRAPGARGGAWVEAPGTQIHLIRAERTEGRLNPLGPHLALEVADFDEIKQALAERGIYFVEAPDGLPFRQLWILDPSGNTVELWGRAG
jgi:catechol 2,3-dioxygenase-like lactoylglutathione lyase family enzyme